MLKTPQCSAAMEDRVLARGDLKSINASEEAPGTSLVGGSG